MLACVFGPHNKTLFRVPSHSVLLGPFRCKVRVAFAALLRSQQTIFASSANYLAWLFGGLAGCGAE